MTGGRRGEYESEGNCFVFCVGYTLILRCVFSVHSPLSPTALLSLLGLVSSHSVFLSPVADGKFSLLVVANASLAMIRHVKRARLAFDISHLRPYICPWSFLCAPHIQIDLGHALVQKKPRWEHNTQETAESARGAS